VVFARGGAKCVESVDLAGTEFDRVRADVLLHPGYVLGAGDRRDVGPFRQQPGQRDLTGCRAELRRDGFDLLTRR